MAPVTTIGLGKTMEKKLFSVGIHSAEELMEIGSKQAVFRLKELYPNTCVVILYHLEAAIRGVEIKQLDYGGKAELKLAQMLLKRIGQGSFVNNLKTYFKEHNEFTLMKLVEENGREV